MARKKKRKASKAEQVADLMEGMSDTQLGEVEDLIAGSAKGKRIRDIEGTVGVDTTAPPTAFAAKRTLGDTGPDAIRSRGAMDASTRAQTRRGLEAQASANTGITPEEPKSRLDRVKGLVGGGARAIGGGIKRAADWANQEELGEGFNERKERIERKDALAAIKPRQGIMEPSFSGFPATPPAATTPPAAGAVAAGEGEEKTSSQRAAEAAKRAYLAQQERARAPQGAGGGPVNTQDTAIQMPETTVTASRPHPKYNPDRFKNAPQNRPSVNPSARGPQAQMTQGDMTSPSTSPKRKIGNLQKEGAEGYEDFGQKPATPAPRRGGNPLTEGSFSTADMLGNAAIKDPFATKKAPQGAQMRAPIKDAGAMRPEAQQRHDEQSFKREVEGLLQRAKQGERRAKEELDALFGKHGGQADRAERGPRGVRNLTNAPGGRILDVGASGSVGGYNMPSAIQNKVLRDYQAEYRAIQNAPSARSRRTR